MQDLKDELASLRIDRDEPRRGKWRVPVLLLVLAAAAAGGDFVRTRSVFSSFGALEVQTVQARSAAQSSAGPNAGMPILTASGYLAARKKSVISRGFKGAFPVAGGGRRRREGGEVIARLEDADYVAAVAKAKADIEYAKADLAELQRQCGLQRGLFNGGVTSQDAVDAAKAASPRRRQPSSRTRPT